ncbi:putative nucleic acid-binding protein [Catalinimonas alkaloidigena]|uniref:type II toxin-antitoxin system VapC family toxin n=1 Tax=Catalinimonas alkaloidigena TaxID=1075417 RepID=UPI0024058866|nr:type II toxin-antitoxin system VapC family toxin [Catalinimonas alkaloidigena]MDF9800335.1 putative nucleic acid-binding protein [Catalinimonas alkaloidigena]
MIDSNIVIYGSQAGYQYLRDYLGKQNIAISKVTLIEVLGYHLLKENEKIRLGQILSTCHQFTIDDVIIQKSIDLKQQKKMSLGDAIIAATALHYQRLLVTANTSDFSWISDLQIHNPIH